MRTDWLLNDDCVLDGGSYWLRGTGQSLEWKKHPMNYRLAAERSRGDPHNAANPEGWLFKGFGRVRSAPKHGASFKNVAKQNKHCGSILA